VEVIQCQGLPNTDAGGAVGNKTDAFVTCTYDSVMTQTDVIDDACSPMWMPWCTRAFVFQLTHPSHALYISVTDYDIGEFRTVDSPLRLSLVLTVDNKGPKNMKTSVGLSSTWRTCRRTSYTH